MRPLLAGLPDRFGIKGQFLDLEAFPLNLTDQVEIDKTVIERGHQRIGGGCRMQGIFIVAARRIDDEEIVALGNFVGQRIEFGDIRPVEHGKAHTGQGDIAPLFGIGAIFEIAKQRTLARIEIDRRDPCPLIGKRDSDMDGGGRFAGSALLICEDDSMR